MWNFNCFKRNLFLILPSLILLSLLTACSEKKLAPDPPLTQSKMILEMFEALEKGDHQTALNKIIKLRELDKTNMTLAKLENLEKNNVCISNAQAYLEKNDPDKALEIIDDGLAILGRNDALLKAREDIIKLKSIPRLLDSLENPLTALKTAKDAVRLKEILSPYPVIAKRYAPFINEKIEFAYQLERNEKWLYISDFASDINLMLENADQNAHLSIAELTVESPRHPVVTEYVNWLNSSSKSRKFDPLLSTSKQ